MSVLFVKVLTYIVWAVMYPIAHFGAEPRALAFCKPSCGDNGFLAGSLQRDITASVRHQFWRSNCAVGR
jgi:hypothetical protein